MNALDIIYAVVLIWLKVLFAAVGLLLGLMISLVLALVALVVIVWIAKEQEMRRDL